MIITKVSLPRRTFLRGLGATLALPLLDGMVPALSAMSRTAAAPVRRMGFVYVPNGVNLAKWAVTGTGTNFEFSPTLSPLAPFRDQLTILSGLDCDPGESWAEGTGDHARPQPAWLSATHPKKAEALVRGGTSIDQIVAQELGDQTQLKSLELAIERTDLSGSCSDSGFGCIYTQTLSWRTPTAPIPMDNNPRTVFERMFGEGTTAAERLAKMRSNRSILDTIPEELARLQKRLSPSDKRRIDEYLYSIRDVERRIQKAEEQSAKLEMLLPDRPAGAPDSFAEHCKLMFDLQVLAYQADVTRVTTFLTGQEFTMRTYPEIGVPDAFHSTSHHQENPEKLEKLARIDTYHVQLFTYFLEKLRATPDGEGSLLDHSMILYGGGLSDGNVHAHVNLPLVVAGGAAGRLKGGRHIQYPKGTPMANLLVSLVNTMDVPLQSIGDSTGPLADFSTT
jgi:hypothetical protein